MASSIVANVVIDLGNSETRVIVQAGGEQRLVTLPNRFAEINSANIIPSSYHLTGSKKAPTYAFDVDGKTFVAGRYSDVEMSHLQQRPSSLEPKHESHMTDLVLRMAFRAAYAELIDMDKVSATGNNKLQFNVVVLVSPSDINYGQQAMEEKIRSITEIDFAIPECSTKVSINEVMVLPEGFCSFLAVIFKANGARRKEYSKLNSSTTLIIDVGAGTTDFSLVRDGEAIDQMKDSVTVGGNNVVQLVRRDLRHQGMIFTEAEIQEAITTGKVKDGSKVVSIVDSLNRAKESVSRSIISTIRDYFEFSSYPSRSVENLLVVGGGALNTVYGAKPISDFLVEYFRSLSPNVELVDLPSEETTDADGEDMETPISPRHLNVLGAAVLARQEL